ncbi:MAG TPA: hypothetical protein VNA24_23720 [Hyalangium sp.]|nr:hypothetical protein [Hyalangium sp.]
MQIRPSPAAPLPSRSSSAADASATDPVTKPAPGVAATPASQPRSGPVDSFESSLTVPKLDGSSKDASLTVPKLDGSSKDAAY